MVEGFGETWFAGSRLASTPLVLRPARVRVRGRLYLRYYANIPLELARWLYRQAGKPMPRPGEEGERLVILTLLAPAKWYHTFFWDDIPAEAFSTVPPEIRRALEALGYPLPVARKHLPLTVLATREELEELGLDPGKIYSLRELAEKLEAGTPRKAREEQAATAT